MESTSITCCTDLGTKNTGITIIEEKNQEIKSEGYLIRLEEQSFTAYQEPRRTKRHQKRNKERRKMAKRLTKLILEKEYNIKLSAEEEKEINALLNRRGFNYITEEIDQQKLENIKDIIIQNFPDKFDQENSIYNQIQKKANNKTWITEILENKNINQKELKPLKETIKKIYDELIGGHKHRTQYFKEIEQEIKNNQKIKKMLQKNNIAEDKLHKLICHISNLPLRVLRKYFNDINMKNGDYWDGKRLKKIINREVRAWHPAGDPDVKKRRAELIEKLKTDKTIMEIWQETSPDTTIQPYEDMNNRRIPRCQTLYLDAQKLSQKYPEWEKATEKLYKKEPNMAENLNPDNKEEKAIILQRFLDRKKELDIYAFRAIAATEKETQYLEQKENLENLLSPQEVSTIRQLAKDYYKEQEQAKKGLWNPSKTILCKCNRHTKHKINMADILISNIVNKRIEKEDVEELYKFIKEEKVNNRKIINIAKDCATTIKSEGNQLKTNIERIRRKAPKERNKEEAELYRLEESAKEAAEQIAKKLDSDSSKIKNIWSLAQIYQILEEDRHGFSTTCNSCAIENLFRMTGDNSNAICSRLFADSTRPIDGVIEKILEKQAFIIAEKISEHAKNNNIEKIDFLIEQNRFEFEESLYDFKSKKPKNKGTERLSKEDRIKSFNKICPYTGKTIEQGEIDHIIPRSYSKKNYNTIINDELNLIYASREGNRQKNNNIIDFDTLHNNFLQEKYGTTDRNTIKAIVKATLQNQGILDNSANKLVFSRLTEETKRDIKIAMFIPEYRKKLIPLLKNSVKARVNGTQAYLIKKIAAKIREKHPDIKIDLITLNPEDIQIERKILAREKEVLRKNKSAQGIYSHIIDSALMFYIYNNKEYEIEKLLPQKVNIIKAESKSKIEKHIKKDFYSKSIFKEGIYGENFIPFILFKDKNNNIKAAVGFDLKNKAELSGNPEKHYNNLKEYLRLADTTYRALTEQLKNKKYIKIAFDKHKIFDFFAEIAKKPAEEEKIKTFERLESLRYTTQKKTIDKWLEDKIKENDFKIQVNLKSFGKNQTITLEYPAKKEMQKILQDPELKNIKEKQEKLKYIKNKYFKRNISKNYRIKARNVFSIPCIKNPSGGFRIKRKNNKKTIYQLVEINGEAVAGFIQKETKLTPLIHPIILNDPNITPVNYIYTDYDKNKIIGLTEWIKIPLREEEKQHIQELEVAPGTKARSFFRITMDIDKFYNICDYKNAYDIPYQIKLDKETDFFEKKEIKEILKKPRNYNINIESMDIREGKITFSYTGDGFMSPTTRERYLNERHSNQ